MANSFELKNCVHCFNHTLQLSAKALPHPFNTGLGKTIKDCDNTDIVDHSDEDIDQDEDNEEMVKVMKIASMRESEMTLKMTSMSLRHWRQMNIRRS